tara:strand:+ start:253 stop:489 length:237 start_codon:yes stop_codon:yes gene_type:complete
MSKKNYFNYDKKTIEKYIKQDIDDILYDNKVKIYISNILAIVRDAENNDINPIYLLKKVKNKLVPKNTYITNKFKLKK